MSNDVTYKEAWKELQKQLTTLAKSMGNVENIGVTMTCTEPKTFVYRLLNTMSRLDEQVAYAEKEMNTVRDDNKEDA